MLIIKALSLFYLCAVVYGYDDISDDINVEAIFGDPKNEEAYIECVVDKGPCTDSMNLQKSHFQEILEHGCQECSPMQKSKTKAVIKILVQKYPHHLAALREKYDPEAKYADKFLKLMLEDE